MRPVEDRLRAALSADEEGLWSVIRDPRPEVISNAILNRKFTEEMAVFLAKKKTVSPEVLGFLAGDVRFKDSYKLKVALCKNPKTPQKITMSLLKFLRIFDLAEIPKDQHINISVRQKVEHMIGERVPSMPLGVKTALARRASTNILVLLMDSGDKELIGTCLDSPVLTEGHLYRLINRPATKGVVIRMIAEHPKWSLGYSVRYALIRKFYTPMNCAMKFIKGMKTADLRDLYSDPKLPTATRPFIFSELVERGEDVEAPDEEVYDLSEDEDAHLTDMDRDS